jgi:hypothetical protein
MMEENEKAKMAAMAQGNAQQAKPSNSAKTLGDMIRDALAEAVKSDAKETPAGEANTTACGCSKCVAERSMKLGPITITGEGDEISAALEKHSDDRYVLEVSGGGADFVENSETGGMGIMFRSEKALAEFFRFIDKVRP